MKSMIYKRALFKEEALVCVLPYGQMQLYTPQAYMGEKRTDEPLDFAYLFSLCPR